MTSYHKYTRFEICKNPQLKRKVSQDEVTSDEDMTEQDFILESATSQNKRSQVLAGCNNTINKLTPNSKETFKNDTTPIYSRFSQAYYTDVEHHFF